ncbi:glycosyltransferase family 4 protein [Paenibacillus humicus]|uniref:glycosyltransferase family 4 protein n=1 Tax=Paenibacillus humicus TaxID=412861 RepID=UPI003F15798A
MKLLYIYKYAILGGVTTQLVNRLSHLKLKCEPHFLFTHDYGGTKAFGSYKHVHVKKDPIEISNYIKRKKFDAVIVIDTPEVYEAIRHSGHKGVVINEVHTTTSNIKYLESFEKYEIDAFIAPSQYLVDRINDEYGFRGKIPAHVVFNCLDTALFNPKKVEQIFDKKIIAWVGKLDDHKNWRSFLSIAYKISRIRSDCVFLLLGGETAKEEVVKSMLDLVDEYGLMDHFIWIQRVEYNDMPLIYSSIAASKGLSISTSSNESFGMTIIESLACGCPSIAPKVGAIPEILQDDRLYYGEDEEEAINKVQTILNNPLEEQKIFEGIQLISEKYSIQKIVDEYINLIKKIMNEKDGKNA